MYLTTQSIKRRLSCIQYAQKFTVSKTCRHFGISRPTYYKWYKRYLKFGEEGLVDRSRKPKNCPNEKPREVYEKILYLRRNYHLGPMKIQMYLYRYHGIKVGIQCIWRTLRRNGIGRLPMNMRYQRSQKRFVRYEKVKPGEQLQIDVKFLVPIEGQHSRYYQYTAVDDCTRMRILKIYKRNNQKSAIDFVDYVLSKFPFAVKLIQTDNGAEFQQEFHWHVTDKNIQHRYIRPRRPYLNGKVERSHRIDKEEFYEQLNGVVISTAEEFNQRLEKWERFYNYERPHGAMNGQTPYEKFRSKLQEECKP